MNARTEGGSSGAMALLALIVHARLPHLRSALCERTDGFKVASLALRQ